MYTAASVILALAGAGVLVFMPLPKERNKRLFQQAMGTVLFTVGLAGFVAVVFLKGQIVG